MTANAHRALKPGGVFYFNVVDKHKIDNDIFVKHTAKQGENLFSFRSAWSYCGQGEKKTLKLRIEKTHADETLHWNDEHSMVAVSFDELTQLLLPYFDVHIFEHDYEKITPRNSTSGNAIFACVKN